MPLTPPYQSFSLEGVQRRLAWVPLLSESLNGAIGGGVVYFLEETVDPIRKRLSLRFNDPLPNGSWNPLQVLVHGFAMANDCMVQRMWKGNHKRVEADVLIKRRGGPEKKNNPMFLGDWKSPKEREQFLQHLRDKFKHWRRSLPDDETDEPDLRGGRGR